MATSHANRADVAVKTMDLTRAAADLLSEGGLAIGLTGRLVQWLAREGIANGEFQYCLEQLRGALYPNETGLQIQHQIRSAHDRLAKSPHIAGLQLLKPGCVGRSMAFDPDFCYVVTTVAAIMTQHDLKFATDAICLMALDEGNYEQQIRKPYSIQKARLMPVVTKIVESIALNIVNCGHGLSGMPKPLSELCKHGVGAPIFAAVTMAAIRSSEDILITCTRLLADVFVWLLAHVDGMLELSIAGRIVYEKKLGTGSKKVVMLVHEACTMDNGTHDKFRNEIEVATCFGSTFRTIMQQSVTSFHTGAPQGLARAKLYQLNQHMNSRTEGLSKSELHRVEVVGQSIIRWIMDLPLMPDGIDEIIFTTQVVEDDKISIPLGKLLRKYPAICNWELTADRRGQCHFVPIDYDVAGPDELNENLSPGQVFQCFPEALDLIELVRKRCVCTSCRKDVDSLEDWSPGCLRAQVTDDILFLIANAIADGFGAPDTSNMADFGILRKGVLKLLSELLCSNKVTWDTWFAVAACVCLGCPWSAHTAVTPEGAGDIAAIQFGFLVVAASWIDLSTELHVAGSFGFATAEGRLQGVETDFALIYSEGTMRPAFSDSTLPTYLQKLQSCLDVDQSEIILQTAIIGSVGVPFRLLLMVKSGNTRRIINPAAALVSLCHSEKTCCSHNVFDGIQSVETYHSVWMFSDILAYWDSLGMNYCNDLNGHDLPDREYMTYYTSTVDTALKLNVALALSPHGCVIRAGRCCIVCADTRAGIKPRIGKARRIVNANMQQPAIAGGK